MPAPKIDPLDVPLRRVRPIAQFIKEGEQITLRLLRKGLIDASKDGKVWTTTPRRILASPYITGRTSTAP